jgi:hypothetical protein
MNSIMIALIGLAAVLVAVQLWIDDCIIRHVSQREVKRYTLFWLYSPHWQWRIFQGMWWHEARRVGLYGTRAAVVTAYVACIMGAFPA